MPESREIWTIPNIISMFRFVLVPVFAWLILAGHDVAAILVLVVAGLTDWLDGVLARRLNQVTVLGRLMDPVADRLYIAVTLVGLAVRDFIPWWLVAVIVLRELLLVLLQSALRARGYGFLHVHMAGKAATFALMYAFPLLLLGTLGGAVGYWATVLGWAFALWGVGLYWVAAGIYTAQTVHVLRRAVAA